MTEVEFSSKLKNPLENEGFLIYKIPDPGGSFGSASKRPFDWVVVDLGIVHFVELKIVHINNPKKFTIDLKRIAEHQYLSLLAIFKRGVKSCWVIYGVQSLKTNRILGCYVLRIDEVEKYINAGDLLLKRSQDDLFLFNKGEVPELVKIWRDHDSR